jgi:hypothetical protein
MTEGPTREFGKRRPAAIQPAAPVKRSNHVALLLMGTFAVGGGAYALMPREHCGQQPGVASDQNPNADCPPRGSSSGGGHGSWGGFSARNSFFSGDTSSNRSPSSASSDSSSGEITRGGFGSFARAFGSHFSHGG